MPKFDASANIAIARKWATAHVIAAVAIGVVIGFILRSLL
jgi:hypothetical protein